MSRISAWCVPGAINPPSARDAPGMSARPAGWNAIGRPVSDSASHTGVYERMMQRPIVVRVRPREAGLQSESRDAARFVGGALRILQRQRADADEPIGCLRAPVGEPVVVDLARLDREIGVLDRAELQAEARDTSPRRRCLRRRAPSRVRARRSRPGSGLRSGGRARTRRRTRRRCRARRGPRSVAMRSSTRHSS